MYVYRYLQTECIHVHPPHIYRTQGVGVPASSVPAPTVPLSTELYNAHTQEEHERVSGDKAYIYVYQCTHTHKNMDE